MKNKYYHATIRKKPVYYTMQKWRGNNIDEILDFLGEYGEYNEKDNRLYVEIPHRYNSYWLTKKEVIPSSYIVKYNEGCFYIYSEDAFYNKYDIVIKVKE